MPQLSLRSQTHGEAALNAYNRGTASTRCLVGNKYGTTTARTSRTGAEQETITAATQWAQDVAQSPLAGSGLCGRVTGYGFLAHSRFGVGGPVAVCLVEPRRGLRSGNTGQCWLSTLFAQIEVLLARLVWGKHYGTVTPELGYYIRQTTMPNEICRYNAPL